jgi:hypothetical protein
VSGLLDYIDVWYYRARWSTNYYCKGKEKKAFDIAIEWGRFSHDQSIPCMSYIIIVCDAIKQEPVAVVAWLM